MAIPVLASLGAYALFMKSESQKYKTRVSANNQNPDAHLQWIHNRRAGTLHEGLAKAHEYVPYGNGKLGSKTREEWIVRNMEKLAMGHGTTDKHPENVKYISHARRPTHFVIPPSRSQPVFHRWLLGSN